MRRALSLGLHLAFSAVSLVWFVLARRGAVLVFTHAPDLDRDGRDSQLGPLVERLSLERIPFLEVTLVPLGRGGRTGFAGNLAAKRRPFVSHAALLAAGRLLGRARAARILLRLVDPRVLYLIDESGSGQTLLSAARRLGIRSIGVQHGDFPPANAQYADPPPGTEAADVLALWSDWFRARLLAVSPLYDEANTVVVGRLRPPRPEREPALSGRLRVLLLSERRAGFGAEVGPHLDVLRRAPDVELRIRAHPGEDPSSWPEEERTRGSLAEDLAWADVALGCGSSALLEALWHRVPAVVLAGDFFPESDALTICTDPSQILGTSRSVSRSEEKDRDAARERVWGPTEGDPAGALLALDGITTQANSTPERPSVEIPDSRLRSS